MAQSFVFLYPVAIGGITNNDSGSNAVLNGVAVPTDQAWDCVDEGGDGDGDTSYVRLDAIAGRTWRFKLHTPAEAGATNIQSIDSLTVYFSRRRANVGTGGRLQLNLLAGGVAYLDPNQPALGTSYGLGDITYTTNPITGEAWDVKEFVNRTFEIGASRPVNTGGTSFVHLSTIYVKLVYTISPWGALSPASGEWEQQDAGSSGWASLPMEASSWTRVTS